MLVSKNDWKIIYTKYEGVQKRAVEFLSKDTDLIKIISKNALVSVFFRRGAVVLLEFP